MCVCVCVCVMFGWNIHTKVNIQITKKEKTANNISRNIVQEMPNLHISNDSEQNVYFNYTYLKITI